MPTHYLDYINRIKDLRAAEEGAREEKEKAKALGERDAEEQWRKAEETARLQADRLADAIKKGYEA